MKPRVFKSDEEMTKFLTKNKYEKILSQEEGWHLCANDRMELELVAVVEPDLNRPASCECAIEKPGHKFPSCTECFKVGYQYVPPKVPIFIYDEDAINFVFQQALRGSKRHQFAIKTHFGSKEFNPFAVIEYAPDGCEEFTYFDAPSDAEKFFHLTVSKYGIEPTNIAGGIGKFVDILDGYRVVLIEG